MPILNSEFILFTGRHTNVLPHDILYFFPPLISPSMSALSAFVLPFIHCIYLLMCILHAVNNLYFLKNHKQTCNCNEYALARVK